MGATTANACEFQGSGKPVASPVYIVDTNGFPKVNGSQTTFISAGVATDTVVKPSSGIYYGMLVSTSATGTPTVYDNASGHTGTAIAVAPASTTGFVSTVSIGVNCVNGITVQGNASNPAITIFWN